MEKSPRGQRKNVSVADAMDRVRWDYRPRGDEQAATATAGDFFDSFPWEGAGEDDDEADGEPGSASSAGV